MALQGSSLDRPETSRPSFLFLTPCTGCFPVLGIVLRSVFGCTAGPGERTEGGARSPLSGHVHARAHARTVTFKYNCVTVRCPRVYIKLSIAISIVLDSRDSLGCPPPPREGAEDASADHPCLPSSTGTPQVPDVTVDCNVRARRRRRRRLSGGATQTGRSGSRTGLVCPSPARMAARQPSDPDGTLPTGAQRDRYTWVG